MAWVAGSDCAYACGCDDSVDSGLIGLYEFISVMCLPAVVLGAGAADDGGLGTYWAWAVGSGCVAGSE